jgi:hypothetical protein
MNATTVRRQMPDRLSVHQLRARWRQLIDDPLVAAILQPEPMRFGSCQKWVHWKSSRRTAVKRRALSASSLHGPNK